MTASTEDKRAAFRALHEAGCFVLPNPWDVGTARMLQGLGFKALATTSSGYAWSCGQSDGSSSRDQVLAHLRAMVAATDLPVNADFESGYARDPEGVAESVRMALDTGVDAALFEQLAPIFGEHLGKARPAATALVCGLVDARMKIEIEVTARRRHWN